MSYANGRKQIAVARLIEILGELPADALVETNAVGNLLVCNAADDEVLGWIDLNHEKLERQ